MKSPRLLNGCEPESASTEVSVDGMPYNIDILSFTTYPPRRAWIHISTTSFYSLVDILGGLGDDGLNHMAKEWTLTLTIRDAGIPAIRAERWERVRIVEESTSVCTVPSLGGGEAPRSVTCAATKIVIEAMKIVRLPTVRLL